MAKGTILITGASSGIGYQMALQLAAEKYDLILVARRSDKLETLRSEVEKLGVRAWSITKDLANPSEAEELFHEIKTQRLQVDMLVNNAGTGLYGEFVQTNLEEETRMINLNVTTLVVLTKLFARDMVMRGNGRILNVASLLSFLPFPYYSVYSATKAFVLAFSETVAAELEGTGVNVLTLCPGPVDTGFNTEEMWRTNAYRANKPVAPAEVAREGVQLLLRGKGKKIVGFNNWFISNLPRITPDFIMMKIKKHLASPSKDARK